MFLKPPNRPFKASDVILSRQSKLLASSDIFFLCMQFGLDICAQGVSPAHIEQREESAFKKLVESAAQVDFRGPTGNFRFYNDSGDPEWIFHIVSQEALGVMAQRLAEACVLRLFP